MKFCTVNKTFYLLIPTIITSETGIRQILSISPSPGQIHLTFYIHCFPHNLAGVKTSEIQTIRSLGCCQQGYFFFNSPKRQVVLEEKINDTEQPDKKTH